MNVQDTDVEAEFLDNLPWAKSRMHAYCDRCERPAATVLVGHIEGASGPGYDIRHCRPCIALHLARSRILAARVGATFVPALPSHGDTP